MKKLHVITLLFLLGSAFSSCAQTSFIKKGAAFMSETAPGTEMVDDNGNPVVQKKIVRFMVYVEFSGVVPEWKHAWYKNQFFDLNPTKIDAKTFDVGIDKATGKRVTLQPANGNQLWQLEFIHQDAIQTPAKSQGKEVIIEGLRQKKSFRYRIPKVINLLTPDAV